MYTRSLIIAAALGLSFTSPALALEPPTAPQSWQYVSAFEIAPEAQSLDLDGDGVGDGGIYEAMRGLQARVLASAFASIEAQVDYPDQEDACELSAEGCGLSPEAAEALEARYTTIIEAVVSVESINYFVAQWVESADFPWALSLGQGRGGAGLGIHGGVTAPGAEAPTFLWGYTIGRLLRSEESQGWMRFESDKPLRLQLPAGPDAPGGAITLRSPVVEMSFDPEGVRGGSLAAGLPVVEVAKLLEASLRLMDAQGVFPEELDIDAVCEAVTASIVAVADMSCGAGVPCLSASFVFDSAPLAEIVVEQPEVPEIPEMPEMPELPEGPGRGRHLSQGR